MASAQIEPGAAASRPWRVSELNAAIADVLAERFGELVWVAGEVSSLRERSGNVYLDLVEHDRDGRRARAELPAVVLRWERRAFDADLATAPGFGLEDGLEVLVGGRVTFYEPWGKVQLQIVRIDPRHSLGAMALARERLLESLRARGVLEANAARGVGVPPLRIGLVTSPGSRAERDLVAVLAASGWAFDVVLAPARVQGPTCEDSVAGALRRLGREHARQPLDVVAVVRGGGSAVDLSGFDSAGVAEAIVAAPFAVWTGVGHEQDRSVADEVAHTAWATPTAVGQAIVAEVDGGAERLVAARSALGQAAVDRLSAAEQRLGRAADGLVGLTRQRLRAARQALAGHAAVLPRAPLRQLGRGRRELLRVAAVLTAAPRGRLSAERRRLGRLDRDLCAGAGRALPRQRVRVARAGADLTRAARGLVRRAGSRLDVAAAGLGALDPARQLARGYSITRDAAGQPLRSVAGVASGARVTSELADGELASRVEAATPHSPGPSDRRRTGATASEEADS